MEEGEGMTGEEKLRANAELAVRTLAPISRMENFGYNRESVEWVEGDIERQRIREDLTPDIAEGTVQVLSSFLGECIIRCYGGTWQEQDGSWAIVFDDRNAAYPFNKLRKQFENGVEAGDGIGGFFRSIGPVFKKPHGPDEPR